MKKIRDIWQETKGEWGIAFNAGEQFAMLSPTLIAEKVKVEDLSIRYVFDLNADDEIHYVKSLPFSYIFVRLENCDYAELDKIVQNIFNGNTKCTKFPKAMSPLSTIEWENLIMLSKKLSYTISNEVIFNPPATILYKDGKKYVSKCDSSDTFDEEKGLMMCLLKSCGYKYGDIKRLLKGAKRFGEQDERLIYSDDLEEPIKVSIKTKK